MYLRVHIRWADFTGLRYIGLGLSTQLWLPKDLVNYIQLLLLRESHCCAHCTLVLSNSLVPVFLPPYPSWIYPHWYHLTCRKTCEFLPELSMFSSLAAATLHRFVTADQPLTPLVADLVASTFCQCITGNSWLTVHRSTSCSPANCYASVGSRISLNLPDKHRVLLDGVCNLFLVSQSCCNRCNPFCTGTVSFGVCRRHCSLLCYQRH